MTLRYLEGVSSSVVVLVGIALTAISAQRLLCPRWSGAPRLLMVTIIGLAVTIGIAEVLGLLQVFRLIPFLLANGVVAAVTVVLARRRETRGDHDSRPRVGGIDRREPWWERAAAVGAVGLLAADWAPGTVQSYRTGMGSIDTLWYHMPFAAQFAHSGSLTSLHNISNDNVVAFYPASSEVLHAVGIVLFGNDVLSPMVNVGWLAVALLAGWCVGSRFGLSSITLVATAAVIGTTELIADEPGSAYNDLVGIALVLAAVAILANLDPPWDLKHDDYGLLVGALAAGMALGMKYPFAVPVVGLSACVVICIPRGRRVRTGLAWSGVAAASGGFWYLRNLIYADNPVPNLHIGLGPVHLPSPPSFPAFSVAHFLSDGSAWHTYFLPGLAQAFGPAWVPLFLLVGTGIALGARARARPGEAPLARVVAAVAIITMLGYLITPQPLLPNSFVYDLRFMALALVLGAVVLPIALHRTRWVTLLVALFGSVLVASQFARGVWSMGPSLVAYHPIAPGLVAGPVVLLVGAAAIRRRTTGRQLAGAVTWTGSALVVVSLLVSGLLLQRFYLENRYATGPQAPLYRWADSVHNVRIGVSGLILNYPLYGNDLTNTVAFVGIRKPHADYAAPPDCRVWRSAVNAGHFQYVVVAVPVSTAQAHSTPGQWIEPGGSSLREVTTSLSPTEVGYLRTDVFAVHGHLNPNGCVNSLDRRRSGDPTAKTYRAAEAAH